MVSVKPILDYRKINIIEMRVSIFEMVLDWGAGQNLWQDHYRIIKAASKTYTALHFNLSSNLVSCKQTWIKHAWLVFFNCLFYFFCVTKQLGLRGSLDTSVDNASLYGLQNDSYGLVSMLAWKF